MTHLRPVVWTALGALTACNWHDALLGPSAVVQEARPTPVPSPTPPGPQPAPIPEPSPEGPPPDDGHFPNNTNPVVSVTAKLYFVECSGQPQFQYQAEAPVGCRIHLDATPRDAKGEHTRARAAPAWYVNDPSLVRGSPGSDYTPTWAVVKAGVFVAYVVIDGVTSNDVVLTFF